MTKWVIAALGAGVLLGIGMLVWKLQAEPERPKRGAEVTLEQPKSPSATRGQLSPPVQLDEPPVVEDTDTTRPKPAEYSPQYLEKLFARAIPNKIMARVAGCYSGEEAEGRMKIDFTIEFYDGGRASFSDVSLVKSIDQPQLEECAVDVIRDMRFRKRRAPDMVRNESIEISIKDLVKRHKQFVRRDEEQGDR